MGIFVSHSLFLVLVGHVLPQGLFPPIQLTVNIATNKPVDATSTCSSPIEGCNSTCPFGDQLPTNTKVELLSSGQLGSGVVR